MIEHLITAAPAVNIHAGQIFGAVGSGAISGVGAVVLVAGTRGGGNTATAGGPPSGGGKKGRIRVRLTPMQAEVIGVATGTFWMSAGSIWSIGEQFSNAFSGMFTNGGFGTAGLGGVSLGLAAIMYFREPSPGKAALLGILAAGVWAEAGGIWGLPKALILTGAHAIGAI